MHHLRENIMAHKSNILLSYITTSLELWSSIKNTTTKHKQQAGVSFFDTTTTIIHTYIKLQSSLKPNSCGSATKIGSSAHIKHGCPDDDNHEKRLLMHAANNEEKIEASSNNFVVVVVMNDHE